MNDRPAWHHALSIHRVWCRDPWSRLILFDILANLFIRDPVFLAYPDRLESVFDLIIRRFRTHLQEVRNLFGRVKTGVGSLLRFPDRHIHEISLPRGA